MNGKIIIRALANGRWQVKVINRKVGRKGQGLVEYILVVVLMGILAIGAITKMGDKTQQGFSKSTDALDTEFKKIK